MAKVWVLVADSTVARIFSAASPIGPLEELETMSHPEGRLREQDLVTDHSGRTFDSAGHGRHGKEPQISHKTQGVIRFAGDVASRLESGRNQGEYDAVALVAEPSFLGMLRDKLSTHTRSRVQLEIGKNLTRLEARDIRKHLPERLYSTLATNAR